MGTKGGPRRAQPTRAHQGAQPRPGVFCSPGWPPPVVICSSIFIYSKIIIRKFLAHLEMCIIGISDVAFLGPEFQLPVFSLFV